VTTAVFLDHFGLEDVDALPGVEELRAAGLLDVRSAVSALGAQALSEAGRPPVGDDDADSPADEPATPDALDEATLVAGLGELPDED
jgi:segregation and condensation protein B